jgi:hypothetical protein
MSGKENMVIIIPFLGILWFTGCFAPPAVRADDYVNNQAEYPTVVPDTGQVRCYDTHKEIPCPEPGEPFYGQDASYSINAPIYKLVNQNGVEIIDDQTTGLSWQRTPDDEQRIWNDAIDYTDSLELSGLTDWRLPQKQELQSILSYGSIPTPLIHPLEKKEAKDLVELESSAWTLTTRIFPSLHAKALNLNDNQGTISDKYEKKYVYAVRGPVLTYGDYLDNGDGTITDQMTGLTWQAMEVLPKNWEQALAYCQQLDLGGFTDWRLPTIKELSTLVNEQQTNPSIDTTYFPATRSAPYWTSTTFTEHPGFAWYVRFDNGLEYNGGYKGRRYFVRSVRGGTIAAVAPQPSLLPRPVPAQEQPLIPSAKPERENMDRLEPYPLNMQQYE